ncbi:MAG: ATP-binding cassette domain-containing protein, partial [Chloroflexota bacterium]
MIELNLVQVVAGGRTILAVEHLAVARGERLAIIGPNGAGKSTLLRAIALLPRPAIGT